MSETDEPIIKSKRRTFYAKIVKQLKAEGDQTKKELMETIEPPTRQERTFERAVDDLREIGVTEEDEEGKQRLIGYENPPQIQVSVGPRPLRMSIPLKKGTAQRIFNKHPIIQNLITRRKGIAYEILTETGIIEKDTHKD